jgi:hypothetical protein
VSPIGGSFFDLFRSSGCTAGDTDSELVDENQPVPLGIDVWDNGSALDDAFDLVVDGANLGRTPAGADRYFDAEYLISGRHQLCIVVVTAPDDVGTFQVRLHGGTASGDMTFTGGGTTVSAAPARGETVCFEFEVP